MDVFRVVGPVMVGPSSSHTAGAVRIGKVVRSVLKGEVAGARVLLHGSFAKTGKGHGTDHALAAGLLGLEPDDPEVKSALHLARSRGVEMEFLDADLGDVHPNTVKITAWSREGDCVEVTASSTGGGNILVKDIDGCPTSLTGERYALVTLHEDRPGVVARIAAYLASEGINIASLHLSRHPLEKVAWMTIETDQRITTRVLQAVQALSTVKRFFDVEKV